MAVSPSTSLRQSPGSSPKRNFGPGQIDENGYRLARLSRCPANLLNAPHMFRMIPIRRVHARHIHSGTDQPLDDSCSVGCRTSVQTILVRCQAGWAIVLFRFFNGLVLADSR